MKPYYADEHVAIYHGDCLELADVWVGADVLVTDPPYGVNWNDASLGRRSRVGRKGKKIDRPIHPARSILNDESSVVRDAALNAWGDKPALVFGSLLETPPPSTRLVAVYVKPLDAGAVTGVATLRRDAEAIYLLGKSNEWVPYGQRSCVFATTWRVAGTPHGIAATSGHPHAKPTDVLRDLIALHSGVVADPFMGSGSTLRAAKDLGREAIGVELDERYCEIAAKRCAQEVLDFAVRP